MITVREVGKEREHTLFNLLQKYLYEMTQYYDDPMDDEGNFSYEYLPRYFWEESRKAYFLYDGDALVGFAMINSRSFTGEKIDNCIAEFTIFPSYRRGGRGMEAIAALKAERKGTWQLKYSTDNIAGARFWQKVKELYHGHEQPLEGTENAITFE